METEECLEGCEGTIVDVTKLGSVRDETVMASFITEYEQYKHHLSHNIRDNKMIVSVLSYLNYSPE